MHYSSWTWTVQGTEKDEPDTPRRVRVVLAMAEPEYETRRTLPIFAVRMLHSPLGHDIVEVAEDAVDAKRLSGLGEALATADVLILSIRRRALASDEMEALKKYLAAGKPLIAIRTSSHAFAPRDPVAQGFSVWPEFDKLVIGGNYTGHHGFGPVAKITAAPDVVDHPIMKDVKTPFESKGSLYQVSPLQPGAKPLLVGEIEGKPPEPVAWTHTYGKAKVFYTSLGYKEDFGGESFPKLLRNAVLWALDTK